jgi:transcriptional regulator with XRE-family HTH domain
MKGRKFMKTKFSELLMKHKMTQTYLSKLANVSQSNISIYCNYQEALESSTVLTRIRLSKAFNMTLQEFERILQLQPSSKISTNKQEAGMKELTEVALSEDR